MRRKPEAFCTTVLIVINVAVFLILSMLGDTEDAAFMLQHGAMYEPFITEGQEYYRIFTCMFLHFGITHLMNNMVMLGALGSASLCSNCEQRKIRTAFGKRNDFYGCSESLFWVDEQRG